VQQSRAYAVRVIRHICADLRDRNGVKDIFLAGFSNLAFVQFHRVFKSPGYRVNIVTLSRVYQKLL